MVLERSLTRARKTVLLGPWLGGQTPAASTALWELPACPPSAPPLCALPGSLMDKKGKILIPGISEAVAPVTEEELALYDKIDFDLDEYTRDVGAETLLHGCKVLPPTPHRLSPSIRKASRHALPRGPRWEGARGAGKDLDRFLCPGALGWCRCWKAAHFRAWN